MKIFFNSCLFISFAVCSDFVITLDNLTNSYDKVKRVYLKYEKDNAFWLQLHGSHSHLKNFLVTTYRTEPIKLFQKIEASQNFDLCFIVIGCIQLALSNFTSCHLWKRHLSAHSAPKTAAKKFFKRTRYFMRIIVRRKDWDVGKEILRILLSLQKKFLPRLGSESEIKVVERRLKEYKFLYDRFDPSDPDAILGTFVHLKSMALDLNEEFLKDPLIRRFIKLFKIYQYHFLSNGMKLPWDPSKLDPMFLYFLLFNVRYRNFSKYMKIPLNHPLTYFKDFNVFQTTFKFYEETIKPNTISINDAMVNGSSDFIKFVRESIDSNIFNLDESDHWYLKAILCLVPIYIY
jgi:hypothetical protein